MRKVVKKSAEDVVDDMICVKEEKSGLRVVSVDHSRWRLGASCRLYSISHEASIVTYVRATNSISP